MDEELKNPWEEVPLCDYESHMSLSTVQQLQTLNDIMKSQFYQYKISTIAILGIAGGNGLEHIDSSRIKAVYGIDINQNFLDTCKLRYGNLKSTLTLKRIDLSNLDSELPMVELLIANLFIEYIGIDLFIKQLSKTYPPYVSCVIQKNDDISFVSHSPYANSFDGVSSLHNDIDKDSLINAMATIGYNMLLFEEYLLPNMKKFIRLDFYICEA